LSARQKEEAERAGKLGRTSVWRLRGAEDILKGVRVGREGRRRDLGGDSAHVELGQLRRQQSARFLVREVRILR